ncbi:MAG: aldehyde dehydrogenase EutE [bacterium]|jgi:propionaldehyde dehydrogenase|nr:aldehyde dehydrogenase EutE [bacterium]
MTNIQEERISRIVDEVVNRLSQKGLSGFSSPSPSPVSKLPTAQGGIDGVFETLEEAAEAAWKAQKQFTRRPMAKRMEIIEAMRVRAREHVRELAEMAVAETGMGRVEDKVQKNYLAINQTPGPEIIEPIAYTGDKGLTLVERAPYGVIGAITPSTNATETIINNGLSILSAGNTVTFNAHPGAKGVANYTVAMLHQAIVAAGGPPNLVTSVANPSQETGAALMKHPLIRLLLVTGGPGVVKIAMASGKKAIAAGPGNPPVVVDDTADLNRAARDIIAGASLDNNIVCIAEKVIIAQANIADQLMMYLKKNGAYELRGAEVDRLTRIVLTPEGHANRKFVGKNANVLLKELGIQAPDSLRLIVCETPRDHPLVTAEQLMPFIPMVRVPNIDDAIDLAVEVEHGFAHTFVMHSKNIEHLHRMACAANCSIFVKNAPSFAGLGLGGEGYTTFSIASPTGEGLACARTFTRERRCVLVDYFRIV